MNLRTASFENYAEDSEPFVVQRVLIVDDSRLQRMLLNAALTRWGYEVFEATTGTEALEICENESPDLIISDWVMPEMSGLALCEAIRKRQENAYVYFILLTSKTGKNEVAKGLDIGADDFLTKPVNTEELRARIVAGERILRMERSLVSKNTIISSALAEIQTLYDELDHDLIEAKGLQQSLLPERTHQFGGTKVSILLQSSGHLGGDLVSYFQISDRRVGFFGLDVSGHGISSALMTARLAGLLSRAAPDQNMALTRAASGTFLARAPCDVATQLNDVVLDEMDSDQYFTLLLGNLDIATGRMVMTQAGHPHPILQRANGDVSLLGEGGFPIGLIPDIDFDQFDVMLEPGDRVLVLSDGITECTDPAGNMLGDEGLLDLVRENVSLSGPAFLEAIIWNLNTFACDTEFSDDVSALLIEYQNPTEQTS